MNVSINSLSSGLMLSNTLYRNQPGELCKLIGQVGYATIAVIAVAETVTAVAASALSLLLYPVSSAPLQKSDQWLRSSAFTVVWAAADCVLNLFVYTLVADERSARMIAHRGDLMWLPPGAVR